MLSTNRETGHMSKNLMVEGLIVKDHNPKRKKKKKKRVVAVSCVNDHFFMVELSTLQRKKKRMCKFCNQQLFLVE